MKKTFYLLLSCCTIASGAYAQIKSRLIAQSLYNYDGTSFIVSDSTKYNYTSSFLGGDLSSRYIAFDNSTTFNFDKASSSFNNFKKSVQRFDTKNHRTVLLTAYWNKSISAWEEAQTFYYYTTVDDSLTSKVEQAYNKGAAAWDNLVQESYTYDAVNNRTSYTLEFWNVAAGKWVGYDRYFYTYDASNNLTKKTNQNWSTSTSSWENVFIDSFTYTPANKVQIYTNIVWDKTISSWKNNKQTVNTYDASDYHIDEIQSGWNATSGSWYNVQKISFVNDSKGNMIQQTLQNWNDVSMSWDNFRKQYLTYDSKNNAVNNYWQAWNSGSGMYENADQRSFTFDAANNTLSNVSSLWNATTSSWDSSIRLSFEYNSFNQLTRQNYESWDLAGFWAHKTGDQLFNYYYENYTNSIHENQIEKGSLSIFPVPAAEQISIALKWENPQAFSARISDINGKLYKQWNVGAVSNYNEQVSVSNLSSGTYFIEFSGYKGDKFRQSFTVLP